MWPSLLVGRETPSTVSISSWSGSTCAINIRRPHRITHLEVLKRAKSITVTWKPRFSKPSFYSVQPTMVSINAPRLPECSPMLPLKQFQYSSDIWRWAFIVFSVKIFERFLFLRLSLPGDRRCYVSRFVSVVPQHLKFSETQTIYDGCFARNSTSAGVFDGLHLSSGWTLQQLTHQQSIPALSGNGHVCRSQTGPEDWRHI